ncbi:MAG: chemotaxis protein CheW [Pseudomonadota bacterium]
MSLKFSQNPFKILLHLEQKSKVKVKQFPSQEEFRKKWSGITFELNGKQLLTPMAEVSEVMLQPSMTHVPGVKSWVLGIVNSRGNLLPVMDLHALLFNKNRRTVLNRQRILVVNHSQIAAGLLVDAVSGIKHFWVDDRSDRVPEMPSELKPFVTHSYRLKEKYYGVFDLLRLVNSDIFSDVEI